jgi:hypothetical protein
MAFFFKEDMQTPTLICTNGDRYVGQTCRSYNGVVFPHGYGTMTKVNGDTYTGYYYEGLRHGSGQYYSASTQRYYNGGFSYDQEDGYAMITCPLPYGGLRQYVGWIKNGQRHGQGQQWETSASGKVTQFEGQWTYDQFNGPGKYTQTEYNTTICCEGTFINGRLEGWGWYSTSPYGTRKSALFQGGLAVRWGC